MKPYIPSSIIYDWQELIDQIVTCNVAKHGSLDTEEEGFRIHMFSLTYYRIYGEVAKGKID